MSATPDRPQPLLALRDIAKTFSSVRANDGISLDIAAGEIHALLGENGAGKTTLLNILSGIYQPDGGRILVSGKTVGIPDPATALRLGIGTVYQHFRLVPNMTVAENLALGAETGWRADVKMVAERAGPLLRDFGLEGRVGDEIRHLSLGERQRVEIVKALSQGARVLLLDEPTSVLSPVEAGDLMARLRALAEGDVAVVLITHKLDEALAVADRVTVLRAGRVTGTLGPADLGGSRPDVERRLLGMLFGDVLLEGVVRPQPAPTAAPIVVMEGVTARDDRGSQAVRQVDFAISAGEIVGLGGVDGNGQREFAEVLAGQRRVIEGAVRIDGEDLANQGVAMAQRHGISLLTDDRIGEGIAPGMSVAENLAMKQIVQKGKKRRFWLDPGEMEAAADKLISEYDIRTPSAKTPVNLLSGGNIQKVLLARELAGNPRLLVCNKPTAGLDVRSAQSILRLLRERADAGLAVVLISNELDELLEVSDRIGVMFGGRLVGMVDRGDADPGLIRSWMVGGRAASGAAT